MVHVSHTFRNLSVMKNITWLLPLTVSLSLGIFPTRPVQAQNAQPLQYFAVAPCRIVDTRFTPGNSSPLIANTVRAFRATGSNFSSQGGTTGSCGIPSGATSVFFNFTVTQSQAGGFLTAYPYNPNNSTPPNSSTINYGPISTVPALANGIAIPICNSTTTSCSNDFYISTAQGTTNLVVDVVGYYAPDNGNTNTALGSRALANNTSTSNTAIGFTSLQNNTTGNGNTAVGDNTLQSNTIGSDNTAIGSMALISNTTGSDNTAIGSRALLVSTTGSDNTAIGSKALGSNTAGVRNIANGLFALYNNTVGTFNTAIGSLALINNTSGGNNIALGYLAGSSIVLGDLNIHIGNQGEFDESRTIRLGTIGSQTSTYIAGISGINVTGAPVFISSSGQLGIAASSRRFKRDINNIGTLSERLLKLRPVSFRYKQPTEKGQHPLQYGLIAEEVAKVFPELVEYDKQGQPFTVYYHLLTPLLLGEVQRQQAQLLDQKTQLTSLRSRDQIQQTEITRLRQQLTTLQAQQEQMLKAVSAKLNELERAVQVNGKAPQSPSNVLTALPSASR
jgi:trimeric autotransporter adhesin